MNIIEQLQALELQKTAILTEANQQLSDTSKSIDERWKLYSAIAYLLPIDSWITKFENQQLQDWMDHRHIERYKTVWYLDMWGWLEDDDLINIFKEEVMASGSRGYTHDW